MSRLHCRGATIFNCRREITFSFFIIILSGCALTRSLALFSVPGSLMPAPSTRSACRRFCPLPRHRALCWSCTATRRCTCSICRRRKSFVTKSATLRRSRRCACHCFHICRVALHIVQSHHVHHSSDRRFAVFLASSHPPSQVVPHPHPSLAHVVFTAAADQSLGVWQAHASSRLSVRFVDLPALADSAAPDTRRRCEQ